MESLFTAFDIGVMHCQAAIDRRYELLFALLLAGVASSWSHCMGMCGPFVVSQVSMRLQSVSACNLCERHRILSAALVPYHLGRIMTYIGLGAAAALVSEKLETISQVRWVGAGLLLIAALSFFLSGVNYFQKTSPFLRTFLIKKHKIHFISQFHLYLLSFFMNASGGFSGFRLGLALGFIPCGLVYGALAASAATGDPLAGAFGMAAFGLGTTPGLVVVGVVGHWVGRTRQTIMARVAAPLMMLNAVVLGYLAWRTAMLAWRTAMQS
ncbi:DsbD_2 domain-containing protein [Azospirillaceae bacterium]